MPLRPEVRLAREGVCRAGRLGVVRDVGCHVQSHTSTGEVRQGLGQEVGGDVAVDEKRLGGVADAGPLGLGVEGDRLRLVEVGGAVDVDVAHPDAGLDDGDGGLADDGLDEIGSPARDDEVDVAARRHEGTSRIMATTLEERDCVCWESLCRKGSAHRLDEGVVAAGGRGATAQDDGVAGLEGEACGVDGDVGTRLVDHPDDAHRHPHLTDLQAVGERGPAHDLTDGVRQGRHVAQRLRHGRDPRVVEPQAVLQALAHPLGRGRVRGPRRWRR